MKEVEKFQGKTKKMVLRGRSLSNSIHKKEISIATSKSFNQVCVKVSHKEDMEQIVDLKKCKENLEAIKEEEIKDEEIKDEEIKDEKIKDEVIKDDEIKDEEIRNEELQDEEIKGEKINNEEIKNKNIKDEEIKDGEIQDDIINDFEIKDGDTKSCNKPIVHLGNFNDSGINMEPSDLKSPIMQKSNETEVQINIEAKGTSQEPKRLSPIFMGFGGDDLEPVYTR